jgi:hypothetical protein
VETQTITLAVLKTVQEANDNNDQMTWIPMFDVMDENVKIINGDHITTRKLEYRAEQYKPEGAADVEADRVWKH